MKTMINNTKDLTKQAADLRAVAVYHVSTPMIARAKKPATLRSKSARRRW
jgi:hypothetical protein